MRADLVGQVASERPTVAGEDLGDLLELLGRVAGSEAADQVRGALSQQVLRSVEVALLSDGLVIDIALNPGIYLGRERVALEERLAQILGQQPPDALLRHVRRLVLSRAAGQSEKRRLSTFVSDVLRNHRAMTDQLRCLDCGYHFVASDMGEDRLDLVGDLGFILADDKLARRLRDRCKPAAKSQLTIDHLVPEAGLGPTGPENLRVACGFCNHEKKIYRWGGEAAPRDVAAAFLALGELSRGLWAARASVYSAIAEAGACNTCGAGPTDTELTAHPTGGWGRETTAPWNMEVVCYDCYDPAG